MRIQQIAVRIAGLAGGVILGATLPAAAEFQVGGYLGFNSSFDSDVTYNDGMGGGFTLPSVSWDGLSFVGDGGAPYYGLRGTYWFDSMPNWGVMLDFTHAKVRANGVGGTFDLLEFTDGLNLLTLNAVYRAAPIGHFQPYFGAGIGAAIPHVEVHLTGSPDPATFEYQLTGVAAQVLAGVDVPIRDNFSIFGEYKLSYAVIDASLTAGGSLQTNIITNHLLLGASFKFGQ